MEEGRTYKKESKNIHQLSYGVSYLFFSSYDAFIINTLCQFPNYFSHRSIQYE